MKTIFGRILLSVLVAALLLSLCACNRKPTTTSEPQTLSARLTQEQAAEFHSALCHILYRTGEEKYVVLLETPEVALEGDTLATAFDGRLLQTERQDSVNLPLSVTWQGGGLCEAPGVLWTLENGEKARSQDCRWTLDTNGAGAIVRCTTPEGEELDVAAWDLCAFALRELDLGLGDGGMLPPAQWPATGQEYYLDFEPRNHWPVLLGPVELDANYVYTFVVTLTDGTVFTTGLSALG